MSRHYDERLVVLPHRRGHVAWSQFNEHYHRLQSDHWTSINRGIDRPWWSRLVRLAMAFYVARSGALLDLATKADVFSRFPLPRDPDVVFYGAEVGWEAALIRALFGGGGRCVLVDCDPRAHQRFLEAPTRLEIAAPAGFGAKRLVLERDPTKIEYVTQDFFDWSEVGAFDLGIDWGLLEHYEGSDKRAVLQRFRANLRAEGRQISAVPRDTWATRLFYATFPDELNFGYRELLSPREHARVLEDGEFEVLGLHPSPTTSIALARPRPVPDP